MTTRAPAVLKMTQIKVAGHEFQFKMQIIVHTLMYSLLRKEYQLYKDLWGLNLKYSHGAGESKNYSKILIFSTAGALVVVTV